MDIRQSLRRLAKADFADAVGMALGEREVSIAHVKKRFNAVTLVSVETRVVDAPPEGRWPVILDFLREFLTSNGIDSARISVALPRRATLLGHLQLPASAAENVDSVVTYELDRIFPAPADELYVSSYWRNLGSVGERIAVSVVAGLREQVDATHREMEAAGFAPSAITATPVALSDYYYFCRGDGEATAGIIYRDGDRDCLTVASDGRLISTVHFDAATESPVDRLAREVESLIPDKIGGGVELIADDDVDERAGTLASILPEKVASSGIEPTWREAVAIGAALGQLNESATHVNLLPADLVQAEEGVGIREMALAAVVVVLAATLAGSIAVKNLTLSNALASEVSRLEPKIKEVTRQEDENRRTLERVELLEQPRARSVLAYLKAMTEAVPKTAYLTTFRYKGDKLEVDGIAENASALIALLERSPYFKNVEFTAPTTKYLQSQERFSLRMELEQ
ncbi:MAG: hypothetical protein E4H03_13255 [Myxococcales bacterium]|nr:MAG: hypothetical protein E4H03_13255 [Myxococcales bacterium]